MATMAPARAHVREAGTGPAVVCIHASASSSAQWRPLMDRLAGRFRTLAVDLYGSGKTPPWPAGQELSLADEVALLEPVFAAAGDRFHVVGHSYGGAVALKAALAHPHRLRSLVVYEPVLFSILLAEDPTQPAAREIVAVRDDTVTAVESGNARASGARFLDYWMGPGTWAGMPEPRRDAVPTRLSAFASLDVPTLYLAGSDSPGAARGVGRLLAKVLPRVTVVEIEGVGHMGPVTHPERINALIERHLETN
jgi:pimeloyl-ACP methyl ester carboxylesterase